MTTQRIPLLGFHSMSKNILWFILVFLWVVGCEKQKATIFEHNANRSLMENHYGEAEINYIASFKEIIKLDYPEKEKQLIVSRHLWGLARALKKQGKLSEIEPYLKKSMEMITNKEHLSDEPEAWMALDSVATLYDELGKSQESAPLRKSLMAVYLRHAKSEQLLDALRRANLKKMYE